MLKHTLKDSQVLFRGKIMPFADATVSIASSPVLYGLSIYTVFSANWNEQDHKLHIFRLKDHYNRLVSSAKIMDFADIHTTHFSYSEFEEAMKDLLKKNEVTEDVLVRVTTFIDEVSAGTRIHGLKNSMSAYVYPLGQIMAKEGVHTCVSSWVRAADNAIPARAKVNGNYVNASLMKNEALRNGYDEAIALDHHGHVAEGTVANIFMVRGGKLITPALSTDILEGITRDTILKLADQLGIKHEERDIDRTELYVADELFFCGSSATIAPILSVDKRLIGTGKAGPVTEELVRFYSQILHGESLDSNNWLTTV